MVQSSNNSALLSAVLQLGQPWTPPFAPLDACAGAGCFTGPPDALAAATGLQQKFAAAALIAAGVCIQGDDGQLRLAPQLTADAGPLVALRGGAGAAPFAIVSGSRTTPIAPDCLSILRDFTTCALLKDAGGELLLVPADQAPLLRLWAVPCAPLGDAAGELNAPYGLRLLDAAKGLSETLGRGFNEQYCDIPEEPQYVFCKSPRAVPLKRRDPFEATFVLAGWAPEGDERQASALRDAVDFFIDMKATQPDLPLRLGVWLPSARHQGRLSQAWRMRDARAFRRELGLSIAADLYTPARALALGLTAPTTTPPSMIEARDTLDRAGTFFAAAPSLIEPYQAAYLAAIQREVAAPMLASVETADPLERVLTCAAADETTGILAESSAYQHELKACVADPGRDPARLEAFAKRRRESVQQLIRLKKFQRDL